MVVLIFSFLWSSFQTKNLLAVNVGWDCSFNYFRHCCVETINMKPEAKIDWSKYTRFQQKVYRAIMKIPAGQVLTYGQVAKLIGQPRAVRAVGNAFGENQDVPIIPCHRVVGYNSIGGYAFGLRRKIQLLKKEGYLK